MKIISWNVNGLRSVWKKGFLDFVKKNNPDILCLQETRVDKSLLNELEIKGYNLYINSAQKKGYSGVAIYSKKEPTIVEFSIGADRFDKEGRALILRFKDFVLLNLYSPHGGRDKSNLKYKLETYDFVIAKIKSILKKEKRVVICGDFNVAMDDIDLARPKQNKTNIMFGEDERAKLKEMVGGGLRDGFREIYPNKVKYTWWPYMANCRGRNIGWRIDYVFVSKSLKIKDGFILNEVMGSDHCPTGVDLE